MPLETKRIRNGVQFSALIQPRSSRNGIVGLHFNSLKIRLTAPPLAGKVNRMCFKFLAKFLRVSSSRISIISGSTARNKTIQIGELSEDELMKKLKPAIEDYT